MSSKHIPVEQYTILIPENAKSESKVNSSKCKLVEWSIGTLLLVSVLFVIWIVKSDVTANVTVNTLNGKNGSTEMKPESGLVEQVFKVDRSNKGNDIVESKYSGKPSGKSECEDFSCQLTQKIVEPKITDIVEKDIEDDDILPVKYAKTFYKKCLDDQHEKRKLWCSSYVENHFKIALLHKFVLEKYKNKEEFITVRNEVSEMSTDLKGQYDRFNTNIFLSESRNTTVYIGVPEWIFNSGKVEEIYKKLSLHENQSFLEQLIEIDTWSNTNQLDKETEECEWTTDSPELAYVLHRDNCIYISLGMLQPPFFHSNLTKALNYGALGTIIGSSLAEGYINPDWQTSKDSPENCLKKQYSSIAPGIFQNEKIASNVDSKLRTLFADNLGLHTAYEAFSRRMHHRHHISESARVVEYKVFFRGYKQASCGLVKREEEFRVNAVLKNSMFGEWFNCSEGSYMNYSSQHTCSFEFKKKSIKKDLSQQFL